MAAQVIAILVLVAAGCGSDREIQVSPIGTVESALDPLDALAVPEGWSGVERGMVSSSPFDRSRYLVLCASSDGRHQDDPEGCITSDEATLIRALWDIQRDGRQEE
jgi:hypothetical protein